MRSQPPEYLPIDGVPPTRRSCTAVMQELSRSSTRSSPVLSPADGAQKLRVQIVSQRADDMVAEAQCGEIGGNLIKLPVTREGLRAIRASCAKAQVTPPASTRCRLHGRQRLARYVALYANRMTTTASTARVARNSPQPAHLRPEGRRPNTRPQEPGAGPRSARASAPSPPPPTCWGQPSRTPATDAAIATRTASSWVAARWLDSSTTSEPCVEVRRRRLARASIPHCCCATGVLRLRRRCSC